MGAVVDLLKLLGDPTRLRILSLLKRESLSVAELQEILDMGQSRISSHLGLLRNAGIVSDSREGKRSFYRITDSLPDPSESRLLAFALEAMQHEKSIIGDSVHLDRVLDKRREEAKAYFNSVAGRLEKAGCPGRSWQAIGHFLLGLVPPMDIVDLGAGEGVLSQLLAKRARSVVCVDNSPQMVKVGTQLADEANLDNLRYCLGDIESVPLQSATCDLALFSQALHHAIHPQNAVREAHRLVRPGGLICIIDLKKHAFEQARELYADQWLGFSANELYHWLRETGFSQISVDTVSREPDPPHFETILAIAKKDPAEKGPLRIER